MMPQMILGNSLGLRICTECGEMEHWFQREHITHIIQEDARVIKKKKRNLTVADCLNVKKILSHVAVQNISESVNHTMGDMF